MSKTEDEENEKIELLWSITDKLDKLLSLVGKLVEKSEVLPAAPQTGEPK
jgi:hypothetical protein